MCNSPKLFINDLSRVIQNAEVIVFADDTNILIKTNWMELSSTREAKYADY
jgi:hypothetical protein